MKIGVDALGGDYSPQVPVQAALEIVREKNWKIVLYGDEKLVGAELNKSRDYPNDNIEVRHCTQKVEMSDNIQVAIRKKDSSMRVGYMDLKENIIEAFVSAGHSGAMLAIGKSVLKTLGNIERPCICALMPTIVPGKNLLLTDAGANMDCTPENLLQFGMLGSIYMKYLHNLNNPRVGLLNVGEEPGKGNEVVKEAFDLLTRSSLNFVGNIEGKQFFMDQADVVVCDGFAGNVLLKTSQGTFRLIKTLVLDEFKSSILSKIGLPFLYLSMKKIQDRLDYAKFGGAPLLGLNGVSIVSHGSSNVAALKYAISFSGWAVEKSIISIMKKRLQEEAELFAAKEEKTQKTEHG